MADLLEVIRMQNARPSEACQALLGLKLGLHLKTRGMSRERYQKKLNGHQKEIK